MTCRVRYVFADGSVQVSSAIGSVDALSDAGYDSGAMSVTVMVLP